MNLLRAALFGICGLVSADVRAAFVYETAGEFLTSGDFNGDGVADVLILDKLTGNARVGYAGTNGTITWSAPLTTSVGNVSGCAVGRFRLTTRDSLAVTAADLNRVELFDLMNTNSSVPLGTSLASGLGPHSLASLDAPFGPPAPQFSALLVASSLNEAPSERLDIVTNFNIGVTASAGQWPESGSFERANALPLLPNGPTLATGLVRGTHDALHLWQFTNAPSVILSWSNLPAGSDYVFGWFNGEALPRFIFYQPGGSNLTIVPMLQTNTGFLFGVGTNLSFGEAVQQVFYLPLGADGSALVRFSDGVQGLTLPGGAPLLSPVYRAGAGAAGNVFTGIVPLPGGQVALFDAPTGSVSSAHGQLLNFDGTNFTQLSATNLPLVSTSATRANLWLFQLEPFVNREPGFVASFNSPAWSDALSGLPTALNVVREHDGGPSTGLGTTTTSNLGSPPAGSSYGLPNQLNPVISVFSYSSPRAAEPVSILIAPSPGVYAGPVQISFTWPGNGRTVYYRIDASVPWQPYAAPFLLTNDATIQYYGTTILSPSRSKVQLATYSLGNSGITPPPPIDTVPGNTNPPPDVSTNQLILSQNGTAFYGRRSVSGAGTIWAINLDGSGETYITTGFRPRVSRDGRGLAFLRDPNPLITQGNPWVRNLTTGQESLLFTNANYTIGYDWDLTGTNLVFDWSCWLWSMTPGGVSSMLPLVTDCFDDAPVVNPVDGRLAFHNLNATAGVSGLYVTTPDLTTKTNLNPNVPGASWPEWSPDGQWLAFADGNNANSAFTGDGGKNLWVMRADGTSLSQISGFSDPVNGFPHGAVWSPDGHALVGAGTIFGTNGLWLIPLTPDLDDCTGPPILLPTSPGDAIDFAGSIVVAAPAPLVVTPPGLFIRQDANAVVVYWSTNFIGFTLEYATNLSATALWAPISGPYDFNGFYYEHSESKTNLQGVRFFRLRYTGGTVTPPNPSLSIRLETNTVVLSWQTTGFNLESKADPSSTTAWNPINGPYPVNGGNFEYREPLNLSQRKFYRLHGL